MNSDNFPKWVMDCHSQGPCVKLQAFQKPLERERFKSKQAILTHPQSLFLREISQTNWLFIGNGWKDGEQGCQ